MLVSRRVSQAVRFAVSKEAARSARSFGQEKGMKNRQRRPVVGTSCRENSVEGSMDALVCVAFRLRRVMGECGDDSFVRMREASGKVQKGCV